MISDNIIELIGERMKQGFGTFTEVANSAFIQDAMVREAQAKSLRAWTEYMDKLSALDIAAPKEHKNNNI